MIKVNSIKLPDDFDIYKKTDGERIEFLEPVSKINIFVGSNNSGKSRFMRILSSQSDFEIKEKGLDAVNTVIHEKINYLIDDLKDAGLIDASSISIQELEKVRLFVGDTLNTNSDKYEPLRDSFRNWSKISKIGSYTSQGSVMQGNLDYLVKVIPEISLKALELLDKIPVYSKSTNPKKVYLPTLRGLRHLDAKHTDFYLDKTREDYFEHQLGGEVTHLKEVEMKRPPVIYFKQEIMPQIFYFSPERLRQHIY